MAGYGMVHRDTGQRWQITHTTSLSLLARRLGVDRDVAAQITLHRLQRAPQLGPTPLSLRVAHIVCLLLARSEITVSLVELKRLRFIGPDVRGYGNMLWEMGLTVLLRGVARALESSPALASDPYVCLYVRP
jgi:hypothetical protein